MGNVRVGTASWADASLVRDSDWYPRRTMKAAARLAYYAEQFSLAEVTTTYYFPPTPEIAASWVERTPDDFRFDLRAWSLFTGHPTFPHSLWPDLHDEVRPEFRDRRNLYAKHLSAAAIDECWLRFRHAIAPLLRAGKLGAVRLEWPGWFSPKEAHREIILEAASRLGDDIPVAIELPNPKWLSPDECDSTLAFLEEHGLTFVCVDGPGGAPVVAATADLAMVRLIGRNAGEPIDWPADGEIDWAARFAYRYSDDELAEWVPRIEAVAASAREIHVIFANCYQDDAVVNGAALLQAIA
jgi:uncharacterized protein YecE (DUF72 family)